MPGVQMEDSAGNEKQPVLFRELFMLMNSISEVKKKGLLEGKKERSGWSLLLWRL
jgi:hypothetical protein